MKNYSQYLSMSIQDGILMCSEGNREQILGIFTELGINTTAQSAEQKNIGW